MGLQSNHPLSKPALKDKTLAAHRAGIRALIAPLENQRDVVKVPDRIRDEMEFHWVDSMDQVISVALAAEDVVAITPVADEETDTEVANAPIELPVAEPAQITADISADA